MLIIFHGKQKSKMLSGGRWGKSSAFAAWRYWPRSHVHMKHIFISFRLDTIRAASVNLGAAGKQRASEREQWHAALSGWCADCTRGRPCALSQGSLLLLEAKNKTLVQTVAVSRRAGKQCRARFGWGGKWYVWVCVCASERDAGATNPRATISSRTLGARRQLEYFCVCMCARERETSTLLYYSSLVGLLCHTHYLIRAQVQFIIQLSIRCVVHVLKPQSAYIRKLSQHSHQTLVLFLDWHRVPTNCDSFSLWMPESINESFCS